MLTMTGRMMESGKRRSSAALPTIAALSTFWEAETTTFDTAVGILRGAF